MFSTPLICCSSGVTTVAATTSALAPGYWPVTLITGGAISGYWAIGSRPKETTPRITKTRDTTAAKIGRSMKKREIRMADPNPQLAFPQLVLDEAAASDAAVSAASTGV